MDIRSILFDRDGTLIEDRHYLDNPDGVVLLSGVGEALGSLYRSEKKLFLVSNQSGVGRGFFSCSTVDLCNNRMKDLMITYGAVIESMVYCPHKPEDVCLCRKPATGMWETLRNQYSLVTETTVMVGDKVEDIQFASNAGLASILVLTGKGLTSCKSLGIPIEGSCMLFPDEARHGYPHAVIKDFTYLLQALEGLEAYS